MVQRTNGKFTNCPRCAKKMSPKPALSRSDNKTLVCRNCGKEESLIAFHGGELPTPAEWPLSYSFA